MARPAATLALVLCVACTEDDGLDLPPLEFHSERARVGMDLGGAYPLCAADLARIDARIEFIEDRLGVRRDDPVTLYLLEFSELPCSNADSNGCYDNVRDVIYTGSQSIDHELVHAVAREIDFPSLFWEEGAAELLAGGTTRKDVGTPLQPADFDTETLFSYRSPAHFSRFLVETRGFEAYGRLMRGESFAAIYGVDASALTAEYERDAPFAYPPFDPCPFPALAEVEEGVWSEDLAFSCDSPDASQFELVNVTAGVGAGVVRSLALDAGTYALELQGGAELIALACHTQELAEEPMPPSNGDLYNEIDFSWGTRLASGTEHILELTAATYRLAISSGTNDNATATLTVRRLD